ncbi:MAG: hypothetical protein HQL73_01400 [Magnetococcales bacterium]|nr:hypothetical protein [Magnetococcales bacterium]
MSNSFFKRWLYQEVQPVWAHQFLDALGGEDTRAKKLAVVDFLSRIQVEESSGLMLIQDRTPGERRAVFEEIYKLFGGEEGFRKKIAGESWTMAVLEKKEELWRVLAASRRKHQILLWGGLLGTIGVVVGTALVLWLGENGPDFFGSGDSQSFLLPDRTLTRIKGPQDFSPQPPLPGQKNLIVYEVMGKTSPDRETPAPEKASQSDTNHRTTNTASAEIMLSEPKAQVQKTEEIAQSNEEKAELGSTPLSADKKTDGGHNLPQAPSVPAPESVRPATDQAPATTGMEQDRTRSAAPEPVAVAQASKSEEPSSNSTPEVNASTSANDKMLGQSMLAIADREMESLADDVEKTTAPAMPATAPSVIPSPPKETETSHQEKPTDIKNPKEKDWAETPLHFISLGPLSVKPVQTGVDTSWIKEGETFYATPDDKPLVPKKVTIVRHWQSPYTLIGDDTNGNDTGLHVSLPDQQHIRFSIASLLGRTAFREGERFEITKDILREMALFIQIVPREAYQLEFDASGVITIPRSFWNRVLEAGGKWVTVSRKIPHADTSKLHIRDIASKKIPDIQKDLGADSISETKRAD